MLYTIQNNYLKVDIESKGAQLWSIQDKEGTEYLWQGDTKYWGDRAVNLFPYIGRLTKGKYVYEDKEYVMDIHGFIKDADLEVEFFNTDKIIFALSSSFNTKKQYTFAFVYKVQYEICDCELQITYIVENKDVKTMYFGIGGHPGFNVPLEKGLEFEDYYLEFCDNTGAMRVGMSEDCFVTDSDSKYPFVNENSIPLSHSLFNNDAIILKNMPKQIHLKTKKGSKQVTVSYPDMNYLGIWHMPHTDAPYVCIEPWSSLPSRKGIVEDITKQDNLICLESRNIYKNSWIISVM